MLTRLGAATAIVLLSFATAAAQAPAPGAAPNAQRHRSLLSVNVPTDKWSGNRAMDDIAALLRFTPRSLDTPGHQKTIDYIQGRSPRPAR